ncbi:hypothetical protein C7S17_0475 [Burkholderia thailandensis]|nr:hypothetical protein [Burkholderia thailandensis]
MKHERCDYRMGILASPLDANAAEWDALVARAPRPTPFLKHAFLSALHRAGCAVDDTGWAPRFVTLADGATGALVAAAPVYAKRHSYGEYVFDWAWADAYQRNGLPYYPKLLCAVPFTPVQGSRLLAVDDDARRRLAATLVALAEQSDVSSLHVLFPTGDEARALADMGMMLREGVQFHWLNDGYRDFDAFLGTLEQKKRKNIRAERRKVADAGVTFRRVRGEDATDADWRFFARCYQQTYREHFSSPYLNLEFFREIGATMPENLLLVIAERDGRPIASALAVYQRGASGAARCTAATGARSNTCRACTSRPRTTSCSNSASTSGSARSKAARRASTSSRAASCRPSRIPRTGSRIRHSPMRSGASSRRRRIRSTRMSTNCASTIRSGTAGADGDAHPRARVAPHRRPKRHRHSSHTTGYAGYLIIIRSDSEIERLFGCNIAARSPRLSSHLMCEEIERNEFHSISSLFPIFRILIPKIAK